MSGLAILEKSASLKHLLERTLGAVQIDIAERFVDPAALQKALNDAPERFDAIVIGVPPTPTESLWRLLESLKESPASLPVVLMTHQRHARIGQWLEERGASHQLFWSDFGRLPNALKVLLPEPQPKSALPPLDRRSVHVLLVDDSASVRMAFSTLLKGAGYDVESVSTLAEARRQLRERKPDLAVIDYFLPDGHGDELVREIHADPDTANILTAIITGSYKEEIIKTCLNAGAVECMFKNEAKELFLARIAALARTVEIQKAARAEHGRVKRVLQSVADGVYGVDLDGRVTFANPSALKLLGRKAEAELIGKSAYASFHSGDADGEDISEAEHKLVLAYHSSETRTGLETVFWREDGSLIPVECSVVPLETPDGREGAAVVFRDISERKSADKLRWELTHDQLTGLSNRRHFSLAIDGELNRLKNEAGYAALLHIDIDQFGHIASVAGKTHADRVLIDVAAGLSARLRSKDAISRLEDDQFAILLSAIQLENLFTLADDFREVLHQVSYPAYGQRRSVAGSIGVAILSRETPSAEYVLEHARVACQLAKRRGRDQTHIYIAESDSRLTRELEAGWVERLKDALRDDRFVLMAHPIIPIDALPKAEVEAARNDPWQLAMRHARAHEIVFEVLIRMVARDGQLISPGVFVPLAERVGMMQKIDLWVISNALKVLVRLNASGARVALNLNLSTQTLQDGESLKLIETLLKGHRVDPRQLIFEVTETQEMSSVPNARKFVQTLKRWGARFALDDFGTGFSSFSHLKNLDVDFVKIDGQFVESIARSEVDQTIVRTIVGLSESMKLNTIAEHVDTIEALETLRALKVDYAQGHLFGEPAALDGLNMLDAPPTAQSLAS
jgi:diguanylate cyclase (GGDEF)-like protein/PAS domain S-box-containing protein